MPNHADTLNSETKDAAPSRFYVLTHPGFNLLMAYAGAAVVILSAAGCYLTGVRVADVGTLALGLGAIAVLVLPVVFFLHEKKRFYLHDSLLVALWAFYFTLLLGFPVTVAARMGMNLPLQDLRFEDWDRMLGIHVPDIQAWASARWVGPFLTRCYLLLFPFMQLAILLPIFIGKLKYSQRFILANLIAFAIGLPIFALLPGIDPWFADHFVSVPDAAMCKSFVLLAIRQPGPYLYQYPAGAICFPSFHVIWAILSVQVFWGIRILRVPACLFATLIVISTVTTGSHYVVDVIGGIIVAAAAMFVANRASSSIVEHRVPSIRFWKS